MTISLNVLNHLGLGLYSNVPAVLAEAVANAWDADAESVVVEIDADDGQIVIEDLPMPWWRAWRATIASWIHAWTRPSHTTFTKPTSCPPSGSLATTHPRLCPWTWSSQFHSDSSYTGVANASAWRAFTSPFAKSPRHSYATDTARV
jgi:hypothetical protein